MLQDRCRAEIRLSNIRHNYLALRQGLPEGCRFLGVVKADAYGHGAVPVARTLQEAGADYLAVAFLDEAAELREAGITLPILILGPTPTELTEQLLHYNITQAVTSPEAAADYSARACALGKKLKVHLKVDSGMSRVGFLCRGEAQPEGIRELVQALQLPGLEVEGIFTHFAVSDVPGEESESYTRSQFDCFISTIRAVEEQASFKFAIRHCTNTGARVDYPEYALDMVRPGLLLYGYGDTSGRFGLKPCMRLVTHVVSVRQLPAGTTVSYGRRFTTPAPMRMGVLGIGYADGLPRLSSGKFSYMTAAGPVQQCGTICMDMCMVDLTGKPTVTEGSEVEIFGEENSLDTLSELAQTIPYEVLCGISKRVPRVYDEE